MIVTQHSGAGKANQYFLRGFNLDHGTDFATWVAGMPVNLRTHAHGQGYTDLNFIIPELVSRVDYYKGPYYAAQRRLRLRRLAPTCTTPTRARRRWPRARPAPTATPRRCCSAAPMRARASSSTASSRSTTTVPGKCRRTSASTTACCATRMPVGDGQLSVTAMAYEGAWTSTDQIPQRAVDDGSIGRFGSLNDSDGGKSIATACRPTTQTTLAGGQLQTTAYGIRYYLNLFSNFTYFLDDPVNGDQFEQYDDRKIFGWNGSWSRRDDDLAGCRCRTPSAATLRQDRIDPVAPVRHAYGARAPRRRARTRCARRSYALYVENQTQWNVAALDCRRARRVATLRRRQHVAGELGPEAPPASVCPSCRS